MITNTGMSIIGAALASLALAVPASAVPVDREKTLGGTETTFAWDGVPSTSVTGQFWWIGEPEGDCGTFPTPPSVGLVDDCDVTEVTTTEPGTLQVDFPEAGDGVTNDWDLYLFAGDATELLASSETEGGAEAVTVDDLEAGTYYVVAVPYIAVQSGYSGTLKLTPTT